MAHYVSGGALNRQQSQPTGPIIDEALRRLSVHGRNSPWRFVDQFNNLLILLLLRAAVLLGHAVDASVILGVVLIRGMMGFVQEEGKAENALTAICTMLLPIAAVLRDGHRISVNAGDLVPGDIVLLGAGDRAPAAPRLTAYSPSASAPACYCCCRSR